MVYTIEIMPVANKMLKKLPKSVQKQIGGVLDRIRIRPYAHIKRLVGSPFYTVRSGNYRAILDIKDEKLIVLVVKIGDRKNVYK